ncbi:unnamed protein product [Absidia cylindrospora]
MLSSNHKQSSSNEYDNPFSSSSDPYSTFIEPDLDLTGQSTRQPTQQPTHTSSPALAYSNPFANPVLSGNIGSSTHTSKQQTTSTANYEYSGEDTLMNLFL